MAFQKLDYRFSYILAGCTVVCTDSVPDTPKFSSLSTNLHFDFIFSLPTLLCLNSHHSLLHNITLIVQLAPKVNLRKIIYYYNYVYTKPKKMSMI